MWKTSDLVVTRDTDRLGWVAAGLGMAKKSGMGIRNCKKRGEWAELCFAARAMQEGLGLGRPWGESSGYDFVVVRGNGQMLRVQVKSTMFREGGGYSCSLKNSRGPYRGNAFDFVAAYVIPEDLWYILPARVFRKMWSISLHPELARSKYGRFKEAWHLLRGTAPAGNFVERIQACAEEREEGAGWRFPFSEDYSNSASASGDFRSASSS